MYTELPKLFDRNFAIAYFLPVSFFLTASTWLLKSMGYWAAVQGWLTGETLFDITLTIFLAWMFGVLLLVLNREIFRFLEGYGTFNPLRMLENRAKQSFRKKVDRVNWLHEEDRNLRLTPKLQEELTSLMEELADRYPDAEDWVLPKRFGNATRAFEVYPRVMYGIEAIDGWPRFLTVIPKEYRELIDDAKAQVDWWMNLGTMSTMFLIEFWIVVFSKWDLTLPMWKTVANILIPLFSFALLNHFILWRAVSSVIGWGDYIKSAFDAYRFSLLKSLGIDIPKSREAEKELWERVSQAVVFRRPDILPELKQEPS